MFWLMGPLKFVQSIQALILEVLTFKLYSAAIHNYRHQPQWLSNLDQFAVCLAAWPAAQRVSTASTVHQTTESQLQLAAQRFVIMIPLLDSAMHLILFCRIMHHARPCYVTLKTCWIYRHKLSYLGSGPADHSCADYTVCECAYL